jgi:hypothetical protein
MPNEHKKPLQNTETLQFNPLPYLLAYIPDEGLHLDTDSLSRIGNWFLVGGIMCKTQQDIVGLLIQFSEWYGLTKLDGRILRKTYGNQNP